MSVIPSRKIGESFATLMPCGFSVDELQLDEPFISVQISHSTEPVLKSLAVLIKDPLNLSLIRLI